MNFRIALKLLTSCLLASSLAYAPVSRTELPIVEPTEAIGPTVNEAGFGTGMTPDDLQFGSAVALDKKIAMGGMPAYRGELGRVAIFTQNQGGTWDRSGTLAPPDPDIHAQFGRALTFEDPVAIVGASDRAYLYLRTRNDWSLTATLLPDSSAASEFGAVIQYSCSLAFVSATDVDGRSSVYVYEIDQHAKPTFKAKLVASDSRPGDRFGESMDSNCDAALIGAPGHDNATGAAYVFTRQRNGAWLQQQILRGSDTGSGAEFGSAVAMSADSIVVGAPFETPEGTHAGPGPADGHVAVGAAYLYRLNKGTWSEAQKLRPTPDQWHFYASFGTSVAIGKDRVAVASPFGLTRYDPGVVFIYGWSGAVLKASIAFEDTTSAGTRMRFSGDQLVFGVPFNGGPLFNTGYAWIYDFGKQ